MDLTAFIELATNLTTALSNTDRYRKLLDILVGVVPCDAACLLRWQNGSLRPLSSIGLADEIMVRNFDPRQHPRLEIIAQAKVPIIFPADSNLPDPFDGFLTSDSTASLSVHSCLGCPLIIEGEFMGILTADAHGAGCFDHLDQQLLTMLSALAGATLRTSQLIETVEWQVAEEKRLRKLHIQESNAIKSQPLLGESLAIQRLRREIDIASMSELPILITGETGTGKEVVARQIHQLGKRRDQALIYVNSAALPESIVESELFGHVRGAFTGAVQLRTGKFELADHGTIFLDEIGEMPLNVQPKLLRALQEGEIQRIGADQIARINVRVIAATNRDLHEEVENHRFRRDLYHRLNVIPIHIPPLRDRRDDVAILAGYFCDLTHKRIGSAPARITQSAKEKLRAYSWPGNVRELKNIIARVMLNAHHRDADRSVLLLDDYDFLEVLAVESGPSSFQDHHNLDLRSVVEQVSLREATINFQKRLISQVLRQNSFHWSKSARQLGMDRSNLYNMAKRLGLLPAET